jgi:two-component system response regulator PilR (NtrC family)
MTEDKMHILVVDDELSMRELLEYMLNKEGYRVTCAENGQEAIKLMDKAKTALICCCAIFGSVISPDWTCYGHPKPKIQIVWLF